MLIPYSTDAPIYHYPVATVTFIVINALVFFTLCMGMEEKSIDDVEYFVDGSGERIEMDDLRLKLESMSEQETVTYMQGLKPVLTESNQWSEELLLQYGKGLRPWQWITSMFMHADLGHLLGNMIFLWAFGLLLEGKMGWFSFSSVYLGMGIFQSFAEQILMFFSTGASLGASGAIFSLLALVVIFAPLNTFETLLFIGIRPLFFETPILVFGGIYLLMNGFFFYLSGASFGTEALHLIGFLVGIPVGLFLLMRGYVDCEGFDIISHYTNNVGRTSKVGKKERRTREKKKNAQMATANQIDQAQVRENLSKQIDQAIQEGHIDLAVALQQKIAASNPGVRWSQPQLIAIIQSYLKSKDVAKAEPLIQLHIDLFDPHRFQLQVKLIKIWLQGQRPRHAIRFMRGMNPAFMSDAEKQEIQKLAEHAKKQIASGVLELE